MGSELRHASLAVSLGPISPSKEVAVGVPVSDCRLAAVACQGRVSRSLAFDQNRLDRPSLFGRSAGGVCLRPKEQGRGGRRKLNSTAKEAKKIG